MLIESLEDRLFFAANAAVSIAADPSRQVLDIEASWKFKKSNPSNAQKSSFDDSTWSSVSLPHTWNNKDGQDGGSNYYRGTGWYRKALDVPASFAGKKVYIQFDGASVVADVYVNGTKIGTHRGAFAAFTFDITDEIIPGQPNLIAVKVNNANNSDIAPISGKNVTLGGPDFTVFGGLYRAVSLIATNAAHITMADDGASGVYVDQSHVSSASADLDIRAKVRNDTPAPKTLAVVADVLDAGGNVVNEVMTSQNLSGNTTLVIEQSTSVPNPHLWNGTRDPYLYQVVVKVLDGGVVVDAVRQPLGIRSFKVDPKNGFFLNGQYLDLHGVDYHQDRIDKGWAKSTADTDQDISIMREMGVNFVRMSHYQQDQYTYDAFDKAGIIVWSEIPYVYDETNSSAFRDNLKQQLVEEIRQNYNHPSVMFWGLYNGLNSDSGANSLVPQLQKLADQEDPGRKTVGAAVERAGIGAKVNTYTDVIGYNDYFGWYRGSYNDIGDFLDSYHDDEPNRAVAISEYGAGGSTKQHKENPSNITATDGKFHPEEYQNLFHENQWRQLKDRKYVFAKTVFSMFDFASDDRKEGDTKGRNDKGLVTYDRQTKKDSFYFYKANWTNTPFAYITSRRYTDRPSKKVEVKVYSTLSSLTLKVNGNTVGTSSGNSINVFKWSNVNLKGGSNTITVSGTRDGQTYTDTVTWKA
jgi:beta-galactosidase